MLSRKLSPSLWTYTDFILYERDNNLFVSYFNIEQILKIYHGDTIVRFRAKMYFHSSTQMHPTPPPRFYG